MTIERTFDMDAVKAILTDKRCYVRMVDDSCPPLEGFEIKDPERFYAILAKENARPVAVFLLFPKTPGHAEVHFCFVPSVWGQTKTIAKAFLGWVWGETSLNLLVGPVPSYNKLALELALSAGFREVDVLQAAGTKNGRPFDLILTEAKRAAV